MTANGDRYLPLPFVSHAMPRCFAFAPLLRAGRHTFLLATVLAIGGCSAASETDDIDAIGTVHLEARFAFDGAAVNTAPDHRFTCDTDDVPLTEDRFGRQRQAYAFQAFDTIDCGDVLDGLDIPLTLSVWAKPETVTGNHTLFMTDYDGSGDAYYGARIKIIDGALEAFYGDGSRAGISGRRGARTESVLEAGDWVHLAAVLTSPTDMTLYIDGQETGSVYSGYGGALRQSDGPLQFGTGTTNGAIDDAYLFSRALTADEVQVLYGAGR